MIVSASYRTDILAFYAGWFAQLLAMGHALVINPHGGKPYRVVLRGEGVDGFVPWTRNMEPFRENLTSLAAQGTAFMVQRMATGYPRPLEASVVSAQQAVATITSLTRQFGKRAVVWRYDPIAFTDLTDPDFYQNNFARLARALAELVDKACISFAQVYRKSRRRSLHEPSRLQPARNR